MIARFLIRCPYWGLYVVVSLGKTLDAKFSCRYSVCVLQQHTVNQRKKIKNGKKNPNVVRLVSPKVGLVSKCAMSTALSHELGG